MDLFERTHAGQNLSRILPVLEQLLLVDLPNPIQANGARASPGPAQRLRLLLYDLITRIPHTEAYGDLSERMTKLLIQCLRKEEEDTALVLLRCIIDLHRSYRPLLEGTVGEFLDFIKDLYRGVAGAITEACDRARAMDQAAPAAHTPGSTPAIPATAPASLNVSTPGPFSPVADIPTGGSIGPAPSPSASSGISSSSPTVSPVPATRSFRVLMECPIIVVMLFQSHPSLATKQIGEFVPLILQLLTAPFPHPLSLYEPNGPMPSSLPPLASLIDSGKAGETDTTEPSSGVNLVSLGPRTRGVFRDIVTAQVKTMSFLAYTLRNFSDLTATHQHSIPGWVVLLLRRVPPEASSTRKELLVAARHILSTEYRMLFTRQIDALLHDRVLLGCGYTSHENLRPLAYSMLADLVHHVRQHLTPQQLSRSVHLFTCNMHDETLPHSIQTMCCKLLLNIIDSLPNLSDRVLGNLMMTILIAFRDKLRMLSRSRNRVVMDDADGKGLGQQGKEEEGTPSIAITTGQVTPHTVREARFLFRNLLGGIKTILHTLRHLPAMAGSRGREGKWRTQEDSDILKGIFVDGLSCFYYYYHPRFSMSATSPATPDLAGSDAEGMAAPGPHPAHTSFPGRSPFASILLRYLLVRLGRLGRPGVEGRRLLALWNLIFSSYKVYPEANEALLLPHVGSLIVRCMRLGGGEGDWEEGIRYYLLLKSLFRTIGSGRYEALYHEVAPLMHFMLEGFNDLLLQKRERTRREVYVELCLTVPVRLNGLLPFIQYLIRPLTLALGSTRNPELSGQGLRTLELCIDHLTPVFLEPILAPVAPKLMRALWHHLRPLGIPGSKGETGSGLEGHALSAQRILGKLGGRNRSILYE
ncbi:hypothetical protein BJ684DRAFT_7988, partial [Piptocephalis cylindrospora]